MYHRGTLVIVLLATFAPAPALAELAIILNSGDESVSLIDRNTYKEVKRFPIGKEPHHLMATVDDQELIVANAASNDLVFLNPVSGEILRRLPRISDPYQIGYSPDKKWFVSASNRLDRVDIYHAADLKLAKRIEAPKTPSHIAFNRDSTLTFVTLQESNDFVAIDLATREIAWRHPVGHQPAGIWMTPDDKYLLVAITGQDHVEVVDWRARKTVQKLKTGKGAHNFLPVGDGRRLLLSNRMANTVSILDMQDLKVLESFRVPGGPDDMELTADGKELWVTSRWLKQVQVIDMDSKKIKHSIAVGRSPHGIYLHSHAPRR